MSPLSPLLRKEIRLLLPAFAAAMVLSITPVWIVGAYDDSGYRIAQIAFGIGTVLVAVVPFGQEFSAGTFSMLLAQPMPRRRIWAVKAGLAAVALLLLTAAFVASREASVAFPIFYYFWESPFWELFERVPPPWYSEKIVASILIALTALAGGLWTTLLFRQIGAAIFFTVLTPITLVVSADIINEHGIGSVWLSPTVVLIHYAEAAILWSWIAFLRAEDTQPLAQSVSMSSVRRASRSPARVAGARRRTPLRAMLTRELLLHQITLFVGCGLLLFHLIALGLRKASLFSPYSDARMILASAPLLWFFLPFLIGSVAVAEERRQGTLEGHHCLPVTRRRQFVVKLGMVLTLGILLGGFAPWALEALGRAFHVPSQLFTDQPEAVLPHWYYATLTQSFGFVPFFWSAFAIASAFLAFFCSTLARHTLHALATAAIAAPALAALIVWTVAESTKHAGHEGIGIPRFLRWQGPLIFLIGAPVLVSVLVGLSFTNYQKLVANRRLWIRSVVILAGALLFSGTATALVYPRPWERWMTLEPSAGPARLRGKAPAKICALQDDPWTLAVLLPDGRIWESGVGYPANRVAAPMGGKMLDRTGWTEIACRGSVEAAVRSDGSLWINKKLSLWPHDLEREGSDTDWASVRLRAQLFFREQEYLSGSGDGDFPLFLKTDGTEWYWTSGQQTYSIGARRFVLGHGLHRGEEPDVRAWVSSAPNEVYYVAPFALGPDGSIADHVVTVPFGELSAPFSRRVDWIAVTPEEGPTFTALAADGALCAWINPDTFTGLLASTRRPLWCVNVLEDSAAAEATKKEVAR